MLVSCWNVNSIRARKDHVLQYLNYHKPDILMLQELKVTADDYPFSEIEALGYQSYIVGQKTYNGVAIITKRDISVEHEFLEGDTGDEQARFIQILDNKTGWRFIDIYLPNGNPVMDENHILSDKFLYKLSWLKRLYDHLEKLMAKDKPFLIGGDWNIAPKDSDTYNADDWKNDALLRSESRNAYYKILFLGLSDALKTVNPNGGYTWWDYRGGGFKRDLGMRIDHILLSPHLADKLLNAGIHKDMRALEKPSDHAPVWVKLNI